MQDLRQGIRLLWRAPGFTVTAVVTLALGIGATTAMYSAVSAVLLNPFPYRDPGQLMHLSEHGKDPSETWSIPYPDFLDWRAQQKSFVHLLAASRVNLTLTGTGEPALVGAAAVSASLVPLLGVEPLLGRGFRDADDRIGADRVAILSHGFWQRRYAADPAVIGRTLILDNLPYTVVGVMPPRFLFWGAELWVPIGLNFEGELHTNRLAHANNFAVGRLAPGVTLEQARAEMRVIAKRLGEQYPDTNKHIGVTVRLLLEQVVSGIRPTLLVLLGAVGCLLLIGCANVANLLLARATARQREMAVRLALGASRGRLYRQVLVECLPLAALGAAAGLLLAYAITHLVVVLLPEGSIPSESVIRIDGRALLFSLVLSVGATLGCALAGALPRAVRSTRALKDEGRGATGGRERRRIGNALVVVEIALSLVLLAGAGLLIGSFHRLQSMSTGFEPTGVLRLQVTLPQTTYATRERTEPFFRDVLERMARVPGVRFAGAASSVPFSNSGGGMPLVTEGARHESIDAMPIVQYTTVQGDYFQAMGIPLRRGRLFDTGDRARSTPVALINEALARRHFAGQNPLGRRILLGIPDNLNRKGLVPEGTGRFEWSTIVGVVGDVRKFYLGEAVRPEAYVPAEQSLNLPFWTHRRYFLLRTVAEPLAVASVAREQIWAIDPDQPVVDVRTMSAAVTSTLRPQRFRMLLLAAFASVAMALAAVGIYGVMSYAVLQRTREVGIRMALGAQRGAVLTTVLGEGARLAATGVALGLAGALLLSRVLQTMLFEISATDPLTFAAVALILTVVALAACYLPARRATRVDPLTALRSE